MPTNNTKLPKFDLPNFGDYKEPTIVNELMKQHQAPPPMTNKPSKDGEMKPIEISNTDRACEVIHGVDFKIEHEMISTIIKIEGLFDQIDSLQSRLASLEGELEKVRIDNGALIVRNASLLSMLSDSYSKDFVQWYSGMEYEKIEVQFKKWCLQNKPEKSAPSTPDNLMEK